MHILPEILNYVIKNKLLKLYSFTILIDIILSKFSINTLEMSYNDIIKVIIIFCLVKISIFIIFSIIRYLANGSSLFNNNKSDKNSRNELKQKAIENESTFKLKLYDREVRAYIDTQNNCETIFEIIVLSILDYIFKDAIVYNIIINLPNYFLLAVLLIYIFLLLWLWEDFKWLCQNNS